MRFITACLLLFVSVANLAAEEAYDTVVVCPRPLVEALRPWLAHRMEQGRKIGVITDCDTPQKIRAGIRAAATGGKLTHVLIVGDDHPLRRASDRLREITVPSAKIDAKVNIRWGSERQIATDNWYADLDDDNVPDVAIGRLTADSPEELTVMIRKIIDYETAPEYGQWRRRVNFIAGVGGFGAVADTILDMATKKFITGDIPAGYQTSMTYASLTSPYCPDPRRLPEVALATHDEGCLFWVYIGHGQRQWLDYMRVEDQAFPILNVDHLKVAWDSDPDRGGQARDRNPRSPAPIAVFLACYTGAFDEGEDCLGEEMLAAPRGPVAVIAGSRVTMPYANAVLGHAMLSHCFAHDHATLGEVLLHAKREAAVATGGSPIAKDKDSEDDSRQLLDALAAAISPHKDELAAERTEHLQMYNLLGDPLLRLRRPQAVELTVNETAAAGEQLKVAGKSPVNGHCTIELVCRRDLLTFDAPRRRGIRLNEETAKQLTETHDRANDQCWTTQQVEIVDGKFATAINLPEACHGHCHVRIYRRRQTRLRHRRPPRSTYNAHRNRRPEPVGGDSCRRLYVGALHQQLLHNLPPLVRQANIQPLELTHQPVMVEAEQVQNGGVQVVDVDRVFDRRPTDVVGAADHLPTFDAAAGHPKAEGVRVMVAAGVVLLRVAILTQGRAAEFAGADDKRFVEQTALLQILNQRGNWLVEHARVVL